MTASKGTAGPSRFLITDHANQEVDGRAVVFGRCDDTTVQLVSRLRHTLQSTDNHPAVPFAINHIAIVPAGGPVLPPAPPVAPDAIALLKDAPHPNAARLLMEYLTSAEGQEVLRQAQRCLFRYIAWLDKEALPRHPSFARDEINRAVRRLAELEVAAKAAGPTLQ